MRKNEKKSIFSKPPQFPILSSWILNLHIIMCQVEKKSSVTYLMSLTPCSCHQCCIYTIMLWLRKQNLKSLLLMHNKKVGSSLGGFGLYFTLFVFVFVFVKKDWLWQLFVRGGAGLDFILRRILCWRRRRGIKQKLGSDFSYHHHQAKTITTTIITIPRPCLILSIWIVSNCHYTSGKNFTRPPVATNFNSGYKCLS